jgi:lipid biosynthesis B12-binding/radical SAM protein
MSRVFLLSTNTMTEPYPVYPLGLAIVASALSRAGHQVRQFDWLVEERSPEGLLEEVQAFGPDFVGVSIRNIDNVDSFTCDASWSLDGDREIVRLLQREIGVPVILGGSAFSIMPEEILDYTGADYGVVGDGGRLFCEWIERFEEGEPLPRVFREADPLSEGDMGVSPFWDRRLLDWYKEWGKLVGIRTKRGCPHRCVYCTYPFLEGRRYRKRSPEAVVEDIERLRTDFGVEGVFFTDSVFNDDEDHCLAIVEELIRREVRVSWSAFFQPGKSTAGHLALMKRSGLYAVESGTDASSDATLAGLDKSFSFADVLAFNEACLGQELPCVHYIMFGGPGETLDTLKEGLENINRLRNSVVLGFSGVRILPGTPLARRAVAEGIIREQDSLLKPVFYFSPGLEKAALNEAVAEAFRGKRQRVFPPSAGQERLKVLNRFGFRGPLWDKLISFDRKRRRF